MLYNAKTRVLMSETMEDLMESFSNWKDAGESKGLKVNIRKTKVMVSRSKGELFKTRQIHVEFVVGKSWSIQWCAQNVETGFVANVQK